MTKNLKILPGPLANNAGVTLIELVMAVAIIGVLSAIAIPAYQGNVMVSRRTVAVSGLMDLSNRQQQFYMNNKTYHTDLSNLGYTAGLVFTLDGDSAVALNGNQMLVAATAADRVYAIKIDSATTTAYAIAAIPQLTQTADIECGTLLLDHTPEKRARLRAAAIAANDDERGVWISVLDSIQGREEILLLLEFGDSHDEGVFVIFAIKRLLNSLAAW